MDSCERSSSYEPNSDGIPIDLFVSKNNKGINTFSLRFNDSSANLVFSVDPPPPPRSHHPSKPPPPPPPAPTPFLKRLLADSSGNPLVSIARSQKARWEGFRKESSEEMFRVERTKNTLSKLEFQVFLNNGNGNGNPDFMMRGSPFFRSCTIYKGDSIVAQTSLMYKLGMQKVVVPRNRFRLTIFPGATDHAFIVALTVIFFYGRKFWI